MLTYFHNFVAIFAKTIIKNFLFHWLYSIPVYKVMKFKINPISLVLQC